MFIHPLSLSIHSYLSSLQTSCVLHGSCLTTCLASAHESISADITLPISLSLTKQQEATAHHQKFFRYISLYGIPTNGAQLQNVRRINACMPLVKKNPLSHVLSHACFSRTFFHLCPLQEHTPSPTKQHLTLFKEPLSFHFRNLIVLSSCWTLIPEDCVLMSSSGPYLQI